MTMPPSAHVGVKGWPNLGQVVDELYEFWKQRIGY
jgi:hypothetical protein